MSTWPQPSTCERCEAPVLLARHQAQGRPIKLDPIEVLPPGSCGECKGRGRISFHAAMRGGHGQSNEPGDLYGQTRRWPTGGVCPVCWGSGQSGEALAADTVLLDAMHGIARPLNGRRNHWEALHHRHQCNPVRSATQVSQSPPSTRARAHERVSGVIQARRGSQANRIGDLT